MPVSNREAYDLKRQGTAVIVICESCGEKVWTNSATYVEGTDEWTCDECHQDFVDQAVADAVGDGDE